MSRGPLNIPMASGAKRHFLVTFAAGPRFTPLRFRTALAPDGDLGAVVLFMDMHNRWHPDDFSQVGVLGQFQ